MAENVGFRLHILCHILVDIQMIGGQIGNDGPGGTALHVHKLEGAELHHRIILRLHLPNQRQQGRADVASQPDGFSRCFQHFRHQRGGCCLAVRAGDRQKRTGADLEEDLHFAGDLRPTAAQGLNGWIGRVHTGGAEQKIGLHPVQVAFSHPQLAASLFQLQNLRVQLVPRGLVTAGDITAVFQQETHQRAVADPKAKHGDFFMLQGRKVFLKFAVHSPFLVP